MQKTVVEKGEWLRVKELSKELSETNKEIRKTMTYKEWLSESGVWLDITTFSDTKVLKNKKRVYLKVQ